MFYNVDIQKLSEYLTVKEASELLGVCKETLRNWDRSGKLKSVRHPLNRYRLYQRKDLEKLLEELGALTNE
jgi:site-specific DNA-methyltransferase (adenine-specific)